MPSQALVALAAALSAASVVQAVQPSTDAAAQRGPYIFNTVFDSLRKYGSTIHPNGMSLYLATVPQGVLFHHGNGHNSTPTTLDWLAYEIEHAEMFARSRMGHPGGPPPILGSEHIGQAAIGDSDNDNDEFPPPPPPPAAGEDDGHGWLHIYRTTRPLQFLYIDGMSGDKGSDGVIDTQDYLLRAGNSDSAKKVAATTTTQSAKPTQDPPGPPGEFIRAEELCDLCAEWQLQGVIRTEGAGTEIIKCDFFDGLEEVQSLRRSDSASKRPGGGGPGGHGPPGRGGPGGRGPGGRRPGGPGGPPRGFPGPFNAENGFRDVGGHRTVLDYQSMVSAFFFSINLTNPDGKRSTFPRLVNAAPSELVAIKAYLKDVVAARRDAPLAPYSWRDVADLVVRRYAPRLVSLANATKEDDIKDGLQSVLNVFLDYSVDGKQLREAEARKRCATFYLQTQTPLQTEADKLLYAGFEAVTTKICGTLLDALSTFEDGGDAAVTSATTSIKELIKYLDWSVFERSDDGTLYI
ncbi:hypothetical protein Sste5346_007076 [Sporothrix stenoceras]|uniref:Uncharacterized protein n=1 Tax=Sporothrix stenoceras TaxID=5173 RepID=A0ABR3YVQ1_9PEZI